MSSTSQLTNKLDAANEIKSSIYAAILAKGGVFESGTSFSDYPAAILSIPTCQPEPGDINYLTFTAEQAGSTLKLDKGQHSQTSGGPAISMEISTDGGITWTPYAKGQTVTLTNIGDSVKFRGENDSMGTSGSNYNAFIMTGRISASGSVITLLDPTDTLRDLTEKPYCFARLFEYNDSITTAPELPATALSGCCYDAMFYDCSNLTTPPDLPGVISFSFDSYGGMQSMFANCTSLTTPPDLSGVTSVGQLSMYNMFNGCTSLTTPPDLSNVTSIVASSGMMGMFQNCSSLTVAPDLSGITSDRLSMMYEMFQYCSSLSEIRVGWSTWPIYQDALTNWVQGVASAGTFHCPPGLEEIFDNSHIPVGWTVVHDVV